jgi:hypothetical protein
MAKAFSCLSRCANWEARTTFRKEPIATARGSDLGAELGIQSHSNAAVGYFTSVTVRSGFGPSVPMAWRFVSPAANRTPYRTPPL